MKTKIIKKFSLKENHYHIFSKDKIDHDNKNPHQKSSKFKIINNENTQTHQLTTNNKLPSAISSISKSLKTMALSSNLYSNYIDLYSNLTQEHVFKTIQLDKHPLYTENDSLQTNIKPLSIKDFSKEKISISTDTSNSFFPNVIKDSKQIKIFNLKSPNLCGKNKIKFDRAKTANSYTAEKDFSELCEKNVFESLFLKKFGIKKIDMNNCFEEKQKNFKFFYEYLKKLEELKNIMNSKNFHRSIIFNGKTAIKKDNIEFKIDIYSLCFKFFSLSNNNNSYKEKHSQKLYFPFALMPFFYLSDFTSFKVLLSKIIIFNKSNNCFEYIKEQLLFKRLKKYFTYIDNCLKDKSEYINNITYNKKETYYSLIYDWIVAKNNLNEEEEEENNDINLKNKYNYKCFKLKIVLPKIKFSVDNLNIKINKFLNKHIIAKLLKNNFKKWQDYVFFDLFSTKKFKIITSLIILNKHSKLSFKKIKLNKNHNVQNKNFEFFLTQIGDNNSLFYTLIPFVVLIVFGDKVKKYQKINLNLKETINLVKYGRKWGFINTLFKCMFLDKMKNNIFFKFELLEDDKKEFYKNTITEENSKSHNHMKIGNSNNDIISNYENIIRIMTHNVSMREKLKFKIQTRYRDDMYEIKILNCTFGLIDITSTDLEEKYYVIPQNILNVILGSKDENEIINMNYTDISLMGKFIGENSKLILSAEEANNISEEQKMIDNADIEETVIKRNLPKQVNVEKKMSINQNIFNRLKTFQIIQRNSVIKQEIKNGEKEEDEDNKIKLQKRYSIKYSFPKGIYFNRNFEKRVTITNHREMNQNRLENIAKDIIRKRTLNLKKYN